MNVLYKLSVIADIFTDAYLIDDSNTLVFLSVWGRDTALQEFLARLQLSSSNNGIRDFHIIGNNTDQYVRLPNVDELDKTTAKTSRESIYGTLTQLWIFDKLAVKPDLANHRALMFYHVDEIKPDPWSMVKMVCPLPLLDIWRDTILDVCNEHKWIRELDKGYGMNAYYIEIKDELEIVMTKLIQEHKLTLPDDCCPVQLYEV